MANFGIGHPDAGKCDGTSAWIVVFWENTTRLLEFAVSDFGIHFRHCS